MANDRIDINKIVKEQVELIKTEEIIKKILERINSQINQLCVEELQMKSQEAETMTGEVEIELSGNDLPTQSIDEINKQPLNLNIGTQSTRSLEETDDEDLEIPMIFQ
uniref:CSON001321 protein n=1 Tax=Culicoides sonorensis TaxID=179676 RepID=A0A336LHP9_CULSO